MKENKKKIYVIGHKNPDTDSVCSAIAYAHLQNQLSDDEYVASRAGTVSKETAFVLDRYNLKSSSKLVLDVEPKVGDLSERDVAGLNEMSSMRQAWISMRDNDVHTLPIISEDKMLEGIVTLQDIALAEMDSLEENNLAISPIPVKNLIESLSGKLIVGDETAVLSEGKVVIGAGNYDAIEQNVSPGDVVIVSNRTNSQKVAIEADASCLIVCLSEKVDDEILSLAKEHNCILITTSFATYKASRLIGQSVPVKTYMNENVESFTFSNTLEEVKEVMSRVKHNYFPVVDRDGHYHGLISKRNLISHEKKNLILVDHNEKSQCVDGFEKANILGIIDHHRLGDIETSGPMFFRNQPVGCTATIIYQMYNEAGVTIEKNIAGIMCCAILSDTLAFRSPTCTSLDKEAATALAKIAGEDIDALAEEMFEAGEDLADRTPVTLFDTDCKILRTPDLKIAIAQGAFYSEKNLKKAISMISEGIDEELKLKNCDMAFYVATSICDKSSDIVIAGEGARELLGKAFHIEIDEEVACLPGVISRKKQFVPALMEVLG